MLARTPVNNTHSNAIRLWLYAVATLVLVMVLVGGGTRLTESGLSITEWKPVMGVLPPLGAAAPATLAKLDAALDDLRRAGLLHDPAVTRAAAE